MLKAYHYWIGYLIPLSLLLGYAFGGMYYFSAAAFAFVVLPILDHFIGYDSINPTQSQENDLRENLWFTIPLLVFVPVQMVSVTYGVYWFSVSSLTIFESAGLILSTGIVTGGLGITIAHELCHRPNQFLRLCGYSLLAFVSYTHFGIEHIAGHHYKVATKEDPATARLGESAYRFILRSVFGGLASAFGIESHRLKKQNESSFSVRNRMYLCIAAPIFIAAWCFLAFGLKGLLFFLMQSAIAVILLELTNYVEHYGLLRMKKADGRYERVTPKHSWNSCRGISNLVLFKLQRHADHHANANRPYQILRHFPESPQLPFGYPTMVLLSLVPALWRRVMDWRVTSLSMQHSLAEIQKVQVPQK